MLRAIKSTTSSLTPARPGSPCSITPATRVISPAAPPTAAARRAAGPSSPPWARRDLWDRQELQVQPEPRAQRVQLDRRVRRAIPARLVLRVQPDRREL